MKNHVYSLLLIISVLPLLSFSQVIFKGRVINANDGQPIPYANLFLKHHSYGTTALNDGRFVLKLDSVLNDSVSVSCVGFKNEEYYIPGLSIDEEITLTLFPETDLLAEVTVTPAGLKILELGFYRNKPSYCSGIFSKYPEARYIPNEDKRPGFLRNIAVYIGKHGIFDAPFRINLLQVSNDSIPSPGEALFNKDFILSAQKGGSWVMLDISYKNIPFPENGFFVMVQPLPIDTVKMELYIEKYNLAHRAKFFTSAPEFGHTHEKLADGYDKSWNYTPGGNAFGVWKNSGWYKKWQSLIDKFENRKNIKRATIGSLMVKVEVEVYQK